MSNVEETVARIYTINFGKAWLTPQHKRTDRVVNMIKEFATQHMKSSQIKIDQDLNRYIWQKGKTNPPRKVRVRIVKDEDDQVIVSLYEDIINEPTPATNTKDGEVGDTISASTETDVDESKSKTSDSDEKKDESSSKSINDGKTNAKQNTKKSKNKT